MKRSLVKQGESTMMVSLPTKWIKDNNLVKGEEIDISQLDNNLLISSKPINKKTETTITLIGVTESIIRTLITNAYRSGYDKIKIIYSNEKQYLILNDVLKTRLIGFDVTKKENEYCLVENITEPSEEQFENIIIKIFYSINNLIELTKNRLETGEKNIEYEEIEERIQRYDNFCRRIITKKKLHEKNSELLWAFLTILIHAQRELYHLNKYLDKTKIIIKEEKTIKRLITIFNLLFDGYQKKDINLLEKIHEQEKEIIYKDIYSLINSNNKNNVVYFHLGLAVKNVYLSSSPLIGILLSPISS